MLLTLTTTHRPATDLGFLLHKHPERLQTFELPFGCAPHECYGVYEPMIRHMQYYVSLVNADPLEGMQQYLERFVYGPKSWNDFLAMVGMDELLEAARAGASIYDA